MSSLQQDEVIEDDDGNTCPLCVEVFDLSDRRFRPCPCGYQVCQFCWKNIKDNVNGLCPACRRPYDEANIQWKEITPEEVASYKAEQAQQAKKKAAARQKEVQKREADSMNRKHLSGLRVVQKNLVYVTGMAPYINQDDEALVQTLYDHDFFGQYGSIYKIVVSKGKLTGNNQQAIGVYVTFNRKEDAATCIEALDGKDNMGRTLRAQYGTTKYCSAYIRGETCNNRKCMFLHEPGDDSDSFTRQDLSSRNAMAAQPSSPPPPQTHPASLAAAAAAPAPAIGKRQDAKDDLAPSVDQNWDAPGLPSTASWANKGQATQLPRRGSRATTSSANSRRDSSSAPAPPSTESIRAELANQGTLEENSEAASPQRFWAPGVPRGISIPVLDRVAEKCLNINHIFDDTFSRYSPEDREIIKNIPCLIDPRGGIKMRKRIEREEAQQRKRMEAMQDPHANPLMDETLESGSLQLGGEPEERSAGQHNQHAIQPPHGLNFGGALSGVTLNDELDTLGQGRGIASTQQQFLLQQLRSGNQQGTMLNSFNGQQQNGMLQGHGNNSQGGHSRQTSRFSFANDSASASASVKPVANAKLMNQQASMMPQQSQSQFIPSSQPQSAGGTQYFSSGIQGPPPGLKTSGTPPVNGVNMFGQGHGFAGNMGFGGNTGGRNANEEMVRSLLRRGETGQGGQMSDASKREYMFPSFLNHHHPPSSTGTTSPAPGLLGNFYNGNAGNGQGGAGVGTSGLFTGSHQEHPGPSQKQKKKGKKHRHANTSSSGGNGGMMDVSDQNLLQARMQQGGSNMMGQQGFYAQGQGQGQSQSQGQAQGQGSLTSLYNPGLRW